jgi:hypothetical protein
MPCICVPCARLHSEGHRLSRFGTGDYLLLESDAAKENRPQGSETVRISTGQFTELASSDFEPWAKESYEIATTIAYRNAKRIGIPKAGNIDRTMVAAAPVLPVGYVVGASRLIGELRSRDTGLQLC